LALSVLAALTAALGCAAAADEVVGEEDEGLRAFGDSLRLQHVLAKFPVSKSALRVALVSESADSVTKLDSARVPATAGELVLSGALTPSQALDEPGVYLAVANETGKFIYVQRVDRPRSVRSETFEEDTPVPRFEEAHPQLRWPVPEGRLVLFEVDERGRVIRKVQESPPQPDTAWEGPVPSVYAVRPADARRGDRTYNVVFAGAGFEERELEVYRATVGALVEGLMALPPFCHYADALAFYRIDVVDPQLEAGNCVPEACEPVKRLSVSPDSGRQAGPIVLDMNAATVEQDLGVARCWNKQADGKGDCGLFWMTDENAVIDLVSSTGMSVHVVVVVLNVEAAVGAGILVNDRAIPGLVVVGATVDKHKAIVSHRLFAHELGHGLGLLDEYTTKGAFKPGRPPHFPMDSVRNVWRPGLPNPWLRDRGCRVFDLVPCCGSKTSRNSECAPCVGSRAKCAYAPADCKDSELLLDPRIPLQCAETRDVKQLCPTPECKNVLLWEGAFYSTTGYYRARERCVMAHPADPAFCDACAWTLHDTVCAQTGGKSCPSLERTLEACPATRSRN